MKYFLLFFLISFSCLSDNYSRSYNPVSGDSISSSLTMAEFDSIQSVINGNLDGDNIQDGTIVRADLGSNAVLLEDINTAANSEDLKDANENFLSGCYLYKVDDDTFGITAGSAMVNGILVRQTSAQTNDPTIPDTGVFLDVYLTATTSTSTWSIEVQDSGMAPGGTTASASNARLIGSIYADSDSDLSYYHNYRDGYVAGWGVFSGNGTGGVFLGTTTFGVTFSGTAPIVVASGFGKLASGTIDDTTDSDGEWGSSLGSVVVYNITTTTFDGVARGGGTFESGKSHTWSWIAIGGY